MGYCLDQVPNRVVVVPVVVAVNSRPLGPRRRFYMVRMLIVVVVVHVLTAVSL
jgi:hypothetical protein